MAEYWGSLFVGILVTFSGVFHIITRKDTLVRGIAPYPYEFGWIEAPLGIIMIIWSLCCICRHRDKKDKGSRRYTDEEISRAKEEMDRIYLREYGKLPEIPETTPSPKEAEEEEKPKKPSKPVILLALWCITLACGTAFCIGIWMMIAGVGDHQPWEYGFLDRTRMVFVLLGAPGTVLFGREAIAETRKRMQLRKRAVLQSKTKDVSPAENSHQPSPDPKA